jgi:hypothetical protein
MFIENIRTPITYGLFPPFSTTGFVDLKSTIMKKARRQGRYFQIGVDDKITLSNYDAIQILRDVNHNAKIKQFLFNPLTVFTFTTFSVVPLFFTSVVAIRIALALINNVGLLFLINQASFSTLTRLSDSYKRMEEVTSTLGVALENEYEHLEIQ